MVTSAFFTASGHPSGRGELRPGADGQSARRAVLSHQDRFALFGLERRFRQARSHQKTNVVIRSLLASK